MSKFKMNKDNLGFSNANLEKFIKFTVGTALTSVIVGLFVLGGDFLFQDAHALALESIGTKLAGF
ncbi:MAG: hypothetical protein ABJN11_07720 [Lentilitoribacter sp.]